MSNENGVEWSEIVIDLIQEIDTDKVTLNKQQTEILRTVGK